MLRVVTRYYVPFIQYWTVVLERRENIPDTGQRPTGIVCVCGIGKGIVRRCAKVAPIGDLASSSLELG
jgi:hypothetical protein